MPQIAVMANGRCFSGASVRVNIAGVTLPTLQKISWKKKTNKTNLYATGRNVNQRTYGRKEFEASITVLMQDYVALQDAAPDFDITDLPPFDMVVSFLEGVKVVTYTLESAEFTDEGLDVNTSDDKVAVELPLIIANVKRSQ